MNRFFADSLGALVLLMGGATGFGCTQKVQGPVPKLEATRDKQVVCNALSDENAELRTKITLRSPEESFSPMSINFLLEDAGLKLPKLFVSLAGKETELRGVQFVDNKTIHATISASSKLAPGEYKSIVENPNGERSEALAFLEIVAPPAIEKVELADRPSGELVVCSNAATRLRIKGSGFRPKDAAPKVELLSCDEAKNLSTCSTQVAELSGVRVESADVLLAELSLKSSLPQDKTLAIRVTNPEEKPCMATQEVSFETASANLSFSAVVPRKGWTGVDTPIQIFGEGFDEMIKLRLRGAGDTGPGSELVDVRVDASGTRIDAIVPAGIAPATGYQLLATGQSGCEQFFDDAFEVLAEPSLTIARVVSPFSWTKAKTPVSIIGTGFESTPRAYLVVPSMKPRLQPLASTSFVNDTSLGSIVRKDLPVGGPYDVVVINPDGGGGKMESSLRVTASTPPSIRSVSPALGDTQTAREVEVSGCNFRSPMRVELVSADQKATATTLGGEPTCDGATVCEDGSPLCKVAATVPTTSMNEGGYVVRAVNEDENTWGDWSLFVVTLPSGKLSTWTKSSESLVVARRDLAAVSGRVNQAARFLYAIGGQSSSDGAALDSIEVIPVDAFGGVGAAFLQRNALASGRSEASVVEHDGYLFVLGGRQDASTALDSVERAKILTLEDQPQVGDAVLKPGKLTAGAWYYQVAAVYDASNADNPSGETLASDEVVVSLAQPGGVEITWSEVPNAVGYRVYRTKEPNGVSSSEVLLAEVGAEARSYVDDGAKAPDDTQRPLRLGETGVWVTLDVKLKRARTGGTAHVAKDPTGALFVYAVGGKGDCGSGVGEMNCVEYAALDAASHTLGSWTESAQQLTSPRYLHGACVGDASKDNQIPTGESWLYLSGGENATSAFEATKIDMGGELLAWQELKPPVSAAPGARTGHGMQLISNAMFVIGGVSGASSSGASLGSAQFSQSFDSGPSDRANFSSSTAELSDARSRYGLVLESGMFYAIGGATGADSSAALSSIESIVY